MKRTKQLMALLLAAAMALPGLSLSTLAVDPSYKVGEISDRAYLLDDDGFVDLSRPTDEVSYGKTFFYPLLNDGYIGDTSLDTNVAAAKKAVEDAQKALEDAIAKQSDAKKQLAELMAKQATLRSNIQTLSQQISDTQKAIDELKSSSSSTDEKLLTEKKAELAKKQTELTELQKKLADKQAELKKLQESSGGASAALEQKKTALADKEKQLTDKKTELTNLTRALEKALSDAKEAQKAGGSVDLTALQKAVDDAKVAHQAAQTARNDAQKKLDDANKANLLPAPDSQAVKDAEAALANAKAALANAERAQNAAQQALTTAKADLASASGYDTAKAAYDADKAAYDLAKSAYDTAKAAYDAAKAAYDALALSNTNIAAALTAYNTPGYDAALVTAFPDDETARAAAKATIDAYAGKTAPTAPTAPVEPAPGPSTADAQAAVDQAQTALDARKADVAAAQTAVAAAETALANAKQAAPAVRNSVDTAPLIEALNKAESALNDAVARVEKAEKALAASQNNTNLDKAVADAQKALDDKKASAEYKAVQDAIAVLEKEIPTLKDEIAALEKNSGNTASEAVTKLQAEIKAIEESVKTLKDAIETLNTEIGKLTPKVGGRSATMPDIETLNKRLAELKAKEEQSQKELNAAEQAAKDAGKTIEGTVKAAVDAANAALAKARTDYQSAVDKVTNVDKLYPFVFESDATRSIRLRTKWEMGGSLVKKVEIVKKRIDYSGGRPSWWSNNASMRYAYMLAVELKPSSTTKNSDLYGNITLNKSGTFGFPEIYLDVYANVTYPEADGDGYIPKTPVLFTKDNGLEGYEEQEFRFAADDNSYFTVNTVNQDKILLGLDCNYDPTIANKFPNANLDFYNGNGATFNRIGVMSIYAPEKSFLYEIKSDGTLSAVNATYDRYDEVLNFKTRTLGRYVVSDRKLDLTIIPPVVGDSSSSGSSSSGSSGGGTSGGGIITVVPSTPPSNNPATGARF